MKPGSSQKKSSRLKSGFGDCRNRCFSLIQASQGMFGSSPGLRLNPIIPAQIVCNIFTNALADWRYEEEGGNEEFQTVCRGKQKHRALKESRRGAQQITSSTAFGARA